MSAEPAGAVDATTEAVAEPKATEQTKPSFADILLKTAQEDGLTQKKVEPEAEPEPEVEPEPVQPTEEETVEEIPVLQDGVPEDQDVDATTDKKDEWPQSAKKRIAEESAKRKHDREVVIPTLTAERDAAVAKAQQLEAQLASATGPAPTPEQPFLDINDPVQLDKIENSYEKILEFALKNPDGAENVLLKVNPDGSEKRGDLTAEDIADMRYKADRAIRKDIPRRRAFLDERAKATAQALEIYPEFKDGNSQMTKEAISILRANPMLESVLGPEALTWIGNALYGRQMRMERNGKHTNGTTPAVSDVVQRVTASAKTKIAPTATRSRSTIERKGTDLAKLTKNLKEKRDEESALDYLNAALSKKGNAKRLEPIGE